jgi:uncharacterized protein YoxC
MAPEITTSIVQGVTVAIPVLSLMVFFHRVRSTTLTSIEGKVNTLDKDLNGLTRQMAATVTDIEQRFLSKNDHVRAMDSLSDNIGELNRRLNTLSGQLFDMARHPGDHG